MMKKTISRKGISTILGALLLVVIVVVASVIVYSWSTGLLGSLMPGTPSVKEGLSMDSYSVAATGPVATLYIRNVGTTDVSLSAAYVDGVPATSFSVASGTATVSSIAVGGGALTVSVTKAGANFAAGRSYEIRLVTVRGTQFTFSIVAS